MPQLINTNIASINAQRNLNKSQGALQTSLQRLSSGLRINSAKDDAAGLAISNRFSTQVRGLNIAMRNANDGISTAQINDGYHQQIYDNLQRLREIAVQLGGTASGAETTALTAENTRIVGLASATGAVVVASNGATVTGVGAVVAAVTGTTIAAIDGDITNVINARANYGADMATFQSAINNLGVQYTNVSAAYSRVMDTDYAVETTNMIRNQILQQAGTAMLAQANQVPNNVLTLLK